MQYSILVMTFVLNKFSRAFSLGVGRQFHRGQILSTLITDGVKNEVAMNRMVVNHLPSTSLMASRSSSSLTRTEVRRMRVAELREELKSRNMDTSGLKQDLMSRLLDEISKPSPQNVDDNDKAQKTKKKKRKSSGSIPLRERIDSNTVYVLRFHGIMHYHFGKASCGLALYDSNTNKIVWNGALTYVTGESAQEAEMKTIRSILSNLIQIGVKRLIIQGDAKGSTVNQLQGNFSVKNKALKTSFQSIKTFMEKYLDECEVWGIPHSQISVVQKIAEKALNLNQSFGFEEFIEHDTTKMATIDNDLEGNLLEITSFDRNEDIILDEQPLPMDDEYLDSTQQQFEEQQNVINLPTFFPSRNYILRFDGGSRGNPGIAGSGSVIYDAETGHELWGGFMYIDKTTNNVAEYNGLLSGLQFANRVGIKRLIAEGDSSLVVNQVNGLWAIKKDHLKDLCMQVNDEKKKFDFFSIDYIPRAENSRADQLANIAMDEKYSMGFEALDENCVLDFNSESDYFEQETKPEGMAFSSSAELFSTSAKTADETETDENPMETDLPSAQESETHLSPTRTYNLRFGGAAKGPIVGASAAILYDELLDETIWSGRYYSEGKDGAQFAAAYSGLVLGLRKALSLSVKHLIIEGSSEFVIKQMKGEWKVKSEVIKPYYLHAKDLCDNYFESVDFELIPASANNNVKDLTQEAIVTKRSNLPGFVAEYS